MSENLPDAKLILAALDHETQRLASMKKADLEDFGNYAPGAASEEPSFLVSKTYEVVTPESAEQGDFDSNGFVYQDEAMDRDDVVRELRRGGYYEPSSSSWQSLRWVSTEPEEDYSDGSNTTYSLHVKDAKGQEIDGETWKALLTEAGVLPMIHMSAFYPEVEEESFDPEFEEPTPCPMCGGPSGILGVLGNTTWLSCRNCGWQHQAGMKTAAEAPNTDTSKIDHRTSTYEQTDHSEAPNTQTAEKDHPEFAAVAKMVDGILLAKQKFDPNNELTD